MKKEGNINSSNRDSKNSSKTNSNSAINLVGCVGGSPLHSSNESISVKKDVIAFNKQASIMSSNTNNQKASNMKLPKYEAQASYDLSFFLQQVGNQSKLISPQLSLALFQFLSSCKLEVAKNKTFILFYLFLL